MREKAKAVQLLESLAEKLNTLNAADSSQRERFQLDAIAVFERVFGTESRQYEALTRIRWGLSVISRDPDENARRDADAQRDAVRRAKTQVAAAIDEVNQFWDLDNKSDDPDPFRRIARLCERFHIMARQLRSRHDGRATLDVSDEYDVQDLMHAMLMLDYDDIRPEEWTPSFAGASSRMDFVLKKERVVIEVKKTRKGLTAKVLGEELIVDSQRYKAHPDCKMLVCFVYDPEGLIANPRGVENDLATAGGELPVKVFIRP